MTEERRRNSKHLLREMRTRAQHWSGVELLAVLYVLREELRRRDIPEADEPRPDETGAIR